jgi:hypothetical protein
VLPHDIAAHPHTGPQENAGGRASESDGDAEVNLTGARRLRWSGKSAMPQEASLMWVGALGHAHEDGWRVRWLGTDGAAGTKARRSRGGLPKGGSSGGADKMNGRVLFYRCMGGGWMG